MPDVARQLERFIRDAFQVAADDPGFNHHVDLFEAGYIDSVGVIETLGFIVDAFGIEVPDSALLSDDFATIEGMARTISSLASVQAPEPEPAGV